MPQPSHRSLTATNFDAIAEGQRQWAKRHSRAAAEGLATISSTVRAADILWGGAEEALKPFGITFNQFELLTVLMYAKSGALSMNKISTRLQLPPASLTHAVSRLEKLGLLQRIPNREDRRSVLVMVTDQGIALAGAATPQVNKYFENIGLDAQDQAQLRAIAAKLRRKVGDVVE
ncbi:MarR family transcriptional regulator [Corynebacterium poyangense]|uniref:MarR family transcriptional regulator n=1 Tax=Corynebacterium poyangense TaxID=2684405 RepID=A0A7H0SL70_9CORY|nr:MarR family transcriptional regulator [Corynebacterium poyangense]MBZ8177384.1 MarR family transcriptional regulator [Corynebacterium poyangense]QNQ89295.1 MarR family transcriptional regulator [Corynebacterium poyangense]